MSSHYYTYSGKTLNISTANDSTFTVLMHLIVKVQSQNDEIFDSLECRNQPPINAVNVCLT